MNGFPYNGMHVYPLKSSNNSHCDVPFSEVDYISFEIGLFDLSVKFISAINNAMHIANIFCHQMSEDKTKSLHRSCS